MKIESPGDASGGPYKGGSAGGGGKGLGRAADSLTAPDAKNSHAPNFLGTTGYGKAPGGVVQNDGFAL